MTTLKVRLLMSKLTFLYCKQSDERRSFQVGNKGAAVTKHTTLLLIVEVRANHEEITSNMDMFTQTLSSMKDL